MAKYRVTQFGHHEKKRGCQGASLKKLLLRYGFLPDCTIVLKEYAVGPIISALPVSWMACTRHLWCLPMLAIVAAAPSDGNIRAQGRGLDSGRNKRFAGLNRRAKGGSMSRGSEVDLGARWRIKVARSGRYLYKHDNKLIGSAAFFSLFEIRSNGDGSYMIADHAGNWVHATLPSKPGEQTELSILKPAPSSPPPPSTGTDRHPANSAFLPPDLLSPFWLKKHSSGAYAMLLDPAGSTYLCQSETDLLKLTVVSNSQQITRWSVEILGDDTELAGINASGLFELHRVIGVCLPCIPEAGARLDLTRANPCPRGARTNSGDRAGHLARTALPCSIRHNTFHQDVCAHMCCLSLFTSELNIHIFSAHSCYSRCV